jgi:hypothetical protein
VIQRYLAEEEIWPKSLKDRIWFPEDEYKKNLIFTGFYYKNMTGKNEMQKNNRRRK